MGERRDRILRFVISGALLGAPLATGCGGEEVEVNEPAPERTNEPYRPEVEDEPDETPNEVAEDEAPVVEEVDRPPTVNNPPSDE